MSPTGTKVVIKQKGWLGAFQMWVNGELLGEVVDVSYRSGVDQVPVVQVALLATPVEIELEGATVELVRSSEARHNEQVERDQGAGGCVGQRQRDDQAFLR